MLIDIWTDQAAIDCHHASPMTETIVSLRKKYDLRMRAERYVTDEGGVPKGGAKYIRE